jgi:hypothetical protein
VKPPLRGDAVGVLEDPDLVEVAGVRVREPLRGRPPLATERELVEGSAAAARTVELVQRSPCLAA